MDHAKTCPVALISISMITGEEFSSRTTIDYSSVTMLLIFSSKSLLCFPSFSFPSGPGLFDFSIALRQRSLSINFRSRSALEAAISFLFFAAASLARSARLDSFANGAGLERLNRCFLSA